MLYIFWFLHQTTTHRKNGNDDAELYIFWFLHQTTTGKSINSRRAELYIFWFLHQTTTLLVSGLHFPGCISFDSYIKPQLLTVHSGESGVVYLLIPTSNHNLMITSITTIMLYIFWFLHQTTTAVSDALHHLQLYIFWFLHQTTTHTQQGLASGCCISFDSYIKPQPVIFLSNLQSCCISFDSYIKPQHSSLWKYFDSRCISFDSYIKPQPCLAILV